MAPEAVESPGAWFYGICFFELQETQKAPNKCTTASRHTNAAASDLPSVSLRMVDIQTVFVLFAVFFQKTCKTELIFNGILPNVNQNLAP